MGVVQKVVNVCVWILVEIHLSTRKKQAEHQASSNSLGLTALNSHP